MKIPTTLHSLLRIKRPSHGAGIDVALDIIKSTIAAAGHTSTEDIDGNIICTTKFTGVLFSCHTDTMHWNEGINQIRVDEFGIITAWSPVKNKQDTYERDVLGADDAAGIYIMLEMIRNNISGTYVFHASEEAGCLGSRALAEEAYSIDGYDLEEDFTHAIAFDRKGTSDLITTQLGEKMASRQLALELASRFNFASPLNYKEAVGVVTDTAMYADYVQECINLSVGYYDEHTPDERLDLEHMQCLLDTILANPTMFEHLPVARELPDLEADEKYDLDDYDVVRPDTVAKLCHDHPGAIAQLLETLGYDYGELFEILTKESML